MCVEPPPAVGEVLESVVCIMFHRSSTFLLPQIHYRWNENVIVGLIRVSLLMGLVFQTARHVPKPSLRLRHPAPAWGATCLIGTWSPGLNGTLMVDAISACIKLLPFETAKWTSTRDRM